MDETQIRSLLNVTLWPRSSSSFDFTDKYEKTKTSLINILEIKTFLFL